MSRSDLRGAFDITVASCNDDGQISVRVGVIGANWLQTVVIITTQQSTVSVVQIKNNRNLVDVGPAVRRNVT